MLEKHQMRSSLNGKEKIFILDKKQDNNTLIYLIKVIGFEPYWTSAVEIEHYWPITCG